MDSERSRLARPLFIAEGGEKVRGAFRNRGERERVEGRRLGEKSVKEREREASLRAKRVLEKLEKSGKGVRGERRGGEAGASVARGRVGWDGRRWKNIVSPRDPEDWRTPLGREP